MSLRNACDDRVVHRSTYNRAVRLDEDTVRIAVVNDRLLLTKRMQLNLVHSGGLQPNALDLFEVVDVVIGDANVAQFACLLGVHKRFVRVEAELATFGWVVDEVQINVVWHQSMSVVLWRKSGGMARTESEDLQ